MMKFLSIKLVLSLFALNLAVGIVVDPANGSNATNRPNILVVLVDDMGWSDIAPYGGEIHTPTLSRLAAGGLRFRHFYNEARCSPSRMALLTGLHMQSVAHEPNDALPFLRTDNNVTIPEVLSANGYRTYFAGKWHLGYRSALRNPLNRGFQHVFGQGPNADGAGGEYWGDGVNYKFISSTDEISPLTYSTAYSHSYPPESLAYTTDSFLTTDNFYTTDANTDYVLKYLEHHSAKNDGAPFFIYLAYNAPHFDLQAPKALIDLYTDVGQSSTAANDVDLYRYEVGWDLTRQLRYERQIAQGVIGHEHRLSPMSYQPNAPGGGAIPAWDSLPTAEKNDLARRMATYAACVNRVDWNLNRIVSRLEATGELNNTLIVFMSDNGGNSESDIKGTTNPGSIHTAAAPLTGTRLEEMGQKGEPTLTLGGAWANVNNTPLRFFKKNTHEGGSRTPMIVHWPAGIPASVKGAWSDQRGHVIDIMPTILGITGISYPATNPAGSAVLPLQGTSLVPVLQGGALAPRDLFIEHTRNRAMFRGKWKLVTKIFTAAGTDLPAHALELYNMEVDPSEMNNLAAYKTQLLAEMVDAFNAWVTGQPGLGTNRLLAPVTPDSTIFAMPIGTELFYDTFSRLNSGDLDAASGGISGTYAGRNLEPIGGTYDESYGEARSEITGNRLRMGIGGTSEVGLRMNFTGQDIINSGGFSVGMTINEINTLNTEPSDRYAGFGVGLTQTEATAGGDASSGTSMRNLADCFIELDSASNLKLRKNGVLAKSVNVGASNGILLTSFAPVGGFGAGEQVNVSVYFNGLEIITDSFVWNHDNANHIGLSSRATAYTETDNITVRLLPIGSAQFANYTLGKGLSGSAGERDSDPDQDGTANWMEWAWGTDPAVPDGPTKSLLIQTESSGQIQLLQRQLKEAATNGMRYRIFYSTDLSVPRSDWAELAPVVHAENTDSNDARYIQRTLHLPTGLKLNQRLFFILTVEPN